MRVTGEIDSDGGFPMLCSRGGTESTDGNENLFRVDLYITALRAGCREREFWARDMGEFTLVEEGRDQLEAFSIYFLWNESRTRCTVGVHRGMLVVIGRRLLLSRYGHIDCWKTPSLTLQRLSIIWNNRMGKETKWWRRRCLCGE